MLITRYFHARRQRQATAWFHAMVTQREGMAERKLRHSATALF
ncbi:hypothetical protein HMPREF0758_1402 [Serratia odorifera DSM 4582]|uniref:Uncharacterized protein n=1 Tax=Serratia odorifera DSM 4582 TaxID=667129 RepID=D4DZQ2_SEROD|nr:hypothetical protein HMPREF0758_1402 [Serratia odorifera DSM 4582]